MRGYDVIAALKKKFKVSTSRELANRLGMSEVHLHWWKREDVKVTPLRIANLVKSAVDSEVRSIQSRTILPIVEFFPLDAAESRSGLKFELFPAGREDNPLHRGLREELKRANGIYVFYDSRGQAIYVGKAKRQSLWTEMKAAFNRPRDTQRLYRVRHPERRQSFKPAYDQPRQPINTQLRLSEMAAYMSAYEIHPGMIDHLEALLVRGFANDLLNVRMERFAGLPETSRGRRDSNK